jgi:hypothetical protein
VTGIGALGTKVVMELFVPDGCENFASDEEHIPGGSLYKDQFEGIFVPPGIGCSEANSDGTRRIRVEELGSAF